MVGSLHHVKLRGYRPVPVWAESELGQWGALSTAMGILETDARLYTRPRVRWDVWNLTPKMRATKLDTQAT